MLKKHCKFSNLSISRVTFFSIHRFSDLLSHPNSTLFPVQWPWYYYRCKYFWVNPSKGLKTEDPEFFKLKIKSVWSTTSQEKKSLVHQQLGTILVSNQKLRGSDIVQYKCQRSLSLVLRQPVKLGTSAFWDKSFQAPWDFTKRTILAKLKWKI